MNLKYFGIGAFVSVVLLLSIACTPKKIASDITAQILSSGAPSFEMDDDVEIAEQSGLTIIKMLEAFQYDNPKSKAYNTLLARSYANYTQGFVEWQVMQYDGTDQKKYDKYIMRAKSFYTKGKDYGLLALNTNASFKKALNRDLDTFKKSLQSFGKSSVPRLFWTAMNWGSLINLSKDDPLAIAEFPKVEAIMQRVLELDEFYFYGGPHLFFGYAYGSRPRMFGGDPEKSKDHFEKGVNAYERKFLLGIVYYAQVYAVQIQDKALFESLLNEVLNTSADSLPKQRLGNELAKLRARWLLDHEGKYF